MRVTAGRFYKYVPNNLDRVDPKTTLQENDVVRVVNKTGCPRANTMGHCHVEDKEGQFLGLVSTSSLEKCPPPKKDKKVGATRTEIIRFVNLAKGPAINAYGKQGTINKELFASLGQKVAAEIATRLGLRPGSYDIHYNPGGIAVCGDVYLHTDNLYVNFSQSSTNLGFLYRSCKGRKDYTGGRNHWMHYTHLRNFDLAVAALKSVVESE